VIPSNRETIVCFWIELKNKGREHMTIKFSKKKEKKKGKILMKWKRVKNRYRKSANKCSNQISSCN
jgi:hypothetical protein